MRLQPVLLATALLSLPVSAYASGPNLVTNGAFATTTPAASSTNGNFEVVASGTYGTVAGWSTANSPTNSNPYNILFTTGLGANQPDGTSVAGSPTTRAASANGQYASSGNGNEYLAAGYNVTSPNGGNFMALDGDSGVNGYFYTNVTGLTTGNLYEIDFYWAVAELASSSAPNGLTDYLSVGFGNTYGSNAQSTATYAIANQGFSGWKTAQMFFTATGTSQVLSFLSIGTPNGAPPMALLDGVSVTQAPEPATLAVLGVALGGMFMARRRSAKRAA